MLNYRKNFLEDKIWNACGTKIVLGEILEKYI
jgi:hypothetical protein